MGIIQNTTREAGAQASSQSSGEELPQLQEFKTYLEVPTELVIALVSPLGTDNKKIREMITSQLANYNYKSHVIHISSEIISSFSKTEIPKKKTYGRANELIDSGNKLRKEPNNNAILALAATAEISKLRPKAEDPERNAFVISSLKHPAEIDQLRSVYGQGFYLFAVHTNVDNRIDYLLKTSDGMSEEQVRKLIKRDEHEDEKHGQHTRDAFHLADFFIADENNNDKLKHSIARSLDLVFGKPTVTPTFNEFAMFLAFTASLRSADLSRQVGAVVTRGREILSTGANDCPTFGGGLYWPEFVGDEIKDKPDGRDYMRGFDSNAIEKNKIMDELAESLSNEGGISKEKAKLILKDSALSDITEYGRVVHAEMDALLACARSNISCRDGVIFCTTFPCHNCAKHIIASGIKEVVYVEPYPKSKALKFHTDSATTKKDGQIDKLRFKPFIGVGPRKYFDLFSTSLSSGLKLRRKNKDGTTREWDSTKSLPRLRMEAVTYRDHEEAIGSYLETIKTFTHGGTV